MLLCPDAPQNIKTPATRIRSLGQVIDDMRSDQPAAHDKVVGECVIDDDIRAEAVVNAASTLGALV